MAPLLLVALVHAAVDVEPEVLRAWLRGELIKIGMTPVWAGRFVEGDELAFRRAREGLA